MEVQMQVLASAALSFAASYLIKWMFPTKASGQKSDNGITLPSISEGTRIQVLLGERKLSGNIIWYGALKSHKHKQKAGKGGGSSSYVTYTYTLSFAIALCQTNGYSASLQKIYQNDEELNLGQYPNIRFYSGHGNQSVDPLLAANMANATAYRNICYCVFEDFDLGSSPSIPALSFVLSVPYNGYAWIGELGDLGNDESKSSGETKTVNTITGYSRYSYKNGTESHDATDSAVGLIEVIIETDETPDDDLFRSLGYGNFAGVYYDTYKKIKSYVVPPDKFTAGLSDYADVAIASGEVWALREKYDLRRWVFSGSFVSASQSATVGWSYYDGAVTGNWDYYDPEVFFPVYQYAVLQSTPSDYLSGGNDIKYIGGIYSFYLYYVVDNTPVTIFLGHDWERDSRELLTRYDVTIPVVSTYSDHDEITVNIDKRTYPWQGVELPVFPEEPEVIWADVVMYLRRMYYYRLGYSGVLPPVTDTKTIEIRANFNIATDYTPVTAAAELLYGRSGLVLGKYREADESVFEVTGIHDIFAQIMGMQQTLSYSKDENIYKINPLYNDEITILDALDELSRYHPFFIKLVFNDTTTVFNFKAFPFTGTLSFNSELEISDVILSQSSVDIKRRSVSDTKNKIRVNYSDKDKKFDRVTEASSDECDVDQTGNRDVQMEMLACTSGGYAQWLADYYLQKNMERPLEITLKTGLRFLKNFELGNIVKIKHEVSGLDVSMIVLETELSDTYQLTCKLQQVTGYVETGITAGTGFGSVSAVKLPVRSIDTAFVLELPKLITAGKTGFVLAVAPMPDDTAYAGSAVYESSDNNTYSYVDQTETNAVYGSILNVFEDNIVVRLTSDGTLNSYSDTDSFLLGGFNNLAYLPDSDMFLRIGSAVQIGTGTWEIDTLIADVMGCPTFNGFSDITPGRIVFLSSEMFFREKPATLSGNTFYYKFAAYNSAGAVQELSDCSVFSSRFNAEGEYPLSVGNIAVNGMASAYLFSAGDLTVTWITRNRNRLNAMREDTDFINFSVSVIVDGDVKRTVTTADTTYVYSETDWMSDGSPAELTISIVKNCAAGSSVAAIKTLEVIS